MRLHTSRRLRRLLTVVLLVTLVASLASVAYVASTSYESTPSHTEFYVLGPDGDAADYPTELSTGESGAFVVGIANNEHRQQTYTVVVVDGAVITDQQTTELADGETWEDEFTVSFDEPGSHEVRILLFAGEEIDDLDDPYRELRLQSAVRP